MAAAKAKWLDISPQAAFREIEIAFDRGGLDQGTPAEYNLAERQKLLATLFMLQELSEIRANREAADLAAAVAETVAVLRQTLKLHNAAEKKSKAQEFALFELSEVVGKKCRELEVRIESSLGPGK